MPTIPLEPLCSHDPDLWFDDDPTLAIKFCRRCPGQAECADLGSFEEYGVWGGKSSTMRSEPKIAFRRTWAMEFSDDELYLSITDAKSASAWAREHGMTRVETVMKWRRSYERRRWAS